MYIFKTITLLYSVGKLKDVTNSMIKHLLANVVSKHQSLELAGQHVALKLFHEAADRVPAYKDFLAKEKINHRSIKTFQDFTTYVPLIDKKNYINQYSFKDLCIDGDVRSNRIISVSSGSSGAPSFWPRGYEQDKEGMAMFGEIYDRIFAMEKKSTLLVVCFSMGTWIAGTFTTVTALMYAEQGRPVNVTTPGLEKAETIKIIKNLASNYDQIVIVGYPPFVKDVIEEGKRAGIAWHKLKTRLLLAGESFSEEWRNYVLNLLGSRDPYYDTSSIYGSADAGIFGIETPLSVLVRRIYNQRSKMRSGLFGTTILPTIVQYDPTRRFFEEVNGELIFTAKAGIPLVRYNIQDAGGILSFDEATEPIKDRLIPMAAQHTIMLKDWKRPFIYVNGRKLFSTTIYAVNIYPENIKAALIDRRVRRWVTGLFTMATKNYSDMDQYFEINIELARDFVAKPEHQLVIEEVIVQKLLKLNGEYHKLHEAIGTKVRPRIHLIAFANPKYFAQGTKHKWVKKED